jgi:aconitate hydratase
VGGVNYGQGSSREHAAIAPRYLGVKAVIVSSFARIHAANLVNFGILPLEFVRPEDEKEVEQGDVLRLEGVRSALTEGRELTLVNVTKGREFAVRHNLSPRQVEVILAGGLLNYFREDGQQ